MPFSNVPEDKQEAMERCVKKVMGDGKDKEAAIAICHKSVVGKGAAGQGRYVALGTDSGVFIKSFEDIHAAYLSAWRNDNIAVVEELLVVASEMGLTQKLLKAIERHKATHRQKAGRDHRTVAQQYTARVDETVRLETHRRTIKTPMSVEQLTDKSGPLLLSMTITKAERMSDGRIRWRARANTGEVDLENERFDKSFWADIVENFFLVAEATSKGLRTPRGLPTPILDISHYSHTLSPDKRNLARAGWPTKLWQDGKALMATGYFDDTPLGALASKAALNRKPEDRRVSICVYPDWGRTSVDVKTGIRTFKGGAAVAYLDHLAMTANPIDPGAQLELEDTMGKSLQVKDDALQVLGEGAKELIDELEEARKASKSQVDDGALIKTDALKQSEGTMNENTETDATEATEEKKDETAEEDVKQEDAKGPATLSQVEIGPIVADELTKALPKIGEAINQRIEPLQKAIEALKAEVDVLKTTETEKVIAALKSDGDWFAEMFGNSVQRVERSAVKDETAAGPQESQSEYAIRYGNKV